MKTGLYKFLNVLVFIGWVTGVTVSAEETLPKHFVDLLRSCRVGPNKVFLGDTKFVYTRDVEMPQPKPVQFAYTWAQYLGWDNGVIFSKLAYIPESQAFLIEGKVMGTNAPVPRPGVSVFIGKESALKNEILPSEHVLTDEKGLFAIKGKVEFTDRLYFCEEKRPVKEYALGEFVQELEQKYRVEKKTVGEEHPLQGRWRIEWGEPLFLMDKREFMSYQRNLIDLDVDGTEFHGHTLPLNGGDGGLTIDGDVSKIPFIFQIEKGEVGDPFGGPFGDASGDPFAFRPIGPIMGEFHRYTLRGTWRQKSSNGDENPERKWVGYRVKVEKGE